MRRALGAVGGVAVAALLAGCTATNGLSFGDGYATGRTMAAARADQRVGSRTVAALCARQWRVSASAVDGRGSWLRGCAAGFEDVQRSLFGG